MLQETNELRKWNEYLEILEENHIFYIPDKEIKV